MDTNLLNTTVENTMPSSSLPMVLMQVTLNATPQPSASMGIFSMFELPSLETQFLQQLSVYPQCLALVTLGKVAVCYFLAKSITHPSLVQCFEQGSFRLGSPFELLLRGQNSSSSIVLQPGVYPIKWIGDYIVVRFHHEDSLCAFLNITPEELEQMTNDSNDE